MTDAKATPTSNQPLLATLDDQALALAARHEPEAFAELYRRHLGRVYRYALAKLGQAQLAEDVTAQTFLAALEQIRTYRQQGAFGGWLLGIARHKVADTFRYRKEMVPLHMVSDLPHPTPRPEQLVIEQLRLEEVALAMKSLSADRAEALALRVFGGLSAREVGQIMGKSEGAVKMLVHRAMSDLQRRLSSPVEAGS